MLGQIMALYVVPLLFVIVVGIHLGRTEEKGQDAAGRATLASLLYVPWNWFLDESTRQMGWWAILWLFIGFAVCWVCCMLAGGIAHAFLYDPPEAADGLAEPDYRRDYPPSQ